MGPVVEEKPTVRPVFVVANVSIMPCMCGFLKRLCPHCLHVFEEGPHRYEEPLFTLQGGMILCVFCGMPTTPSHRTKLASASAS